MAQHDGTTNLSGYFTAATTHTIQDKETAGVNRVGIVRVRGAISAIDSVEWGSGNLMTAAHASASAPAGDVRIYYIVNPPTAATDIIINCSNPTALAYSVASFSDVDQEDPVYGGVDAQGTSTTASATVSSAVGDLVVGMCSSLGPTVDVGADQTDDSPDAITDGGSFTANTSYEPGSASVTHSYTTANAAWNVVALSLRNAGGGIVRAPMYMDRVIRIRD